jgi:hypothetical protein
VAGVPASAAGSVLACDLLTVETAFLQRIYVLFFISLASRRIEYVAFTSNPDGARTAQQARNLIMQFGDLPALSPRGDEVPLLCQEPIERRTVRRVLTDLVRNEVRFTADYAQALGPSNAIAGSGERNGVHHRITRPMRRTRCCSTECCSTE